MKKNSDIAIILAGGTATRLSPMSNYVSKHLLPIYDKPMIYYPLSNAMLTNFRNIIFIVKEEDLQAYTNLLGDGSKFGCKFNYIIQNNPDGIASVFYLAKEYISNNRIMLLLGDNLFFGSGLEETLINSSNHNSGTSFFGYPVSNPKEFGIANIRKDKLESIIEKPIKPSSNLAIPGIYFYRRNLFKYLDKIKKSKRGELEITDLNNQYIKNNEFKFTVLTRGITWLDTGTPDNLLIASQYVKTIQERQGLLICSPEEVAYRKKYISKKELKLIIKMMKNSFYKNNLENILNL